MSSSTDQNESAQASSAGRGYESSDAHFGRLIMIGLGLLGMMVLGMLFSWLIQWVFSASTPQPGAPAEVSITPDPAALPPLPRLQDDPHTVLVELQRREDSMLTSYGWVSRDSGIVRVPINAAMEMVLENGMLKSREEPK